MPPVAFIDANIPIYAAGREHPIEEPCARVLRMAAEDPQSFVTDAEVLQELMHRYLASGRWPLGREVLRAFAVAMLNRIEPVHAEDIHLAAELADQHPGVSSRDLVHAAVMRRLGIDRIISADTDFDHLPGITRLDPAHAGEWGDSTGTGETV
jgi:predicted nucleic acid-binding protein